MLATRLHYVSGYIGMCGGFTLANVIKSNLEGDPYNGYVFVSTNRRKMLESGRLPAHLRLTQRSAFELKQESVIAKGRIYSPSMNFPK